MTAIFGWSRRSGEGAQRGGLMRAQRLLAQKQGIASSFEAAHILEADSACAFSEPYSACLLPLPRLSRAAHRLEGLAVDHRPELARSLAGSKRGHPVIGAGIDIPASASRDTDGRDGILNWDSGPVGQKICRAGLPNKLLVK